MSLELITAPPVNPVTDQEVYNHLRVGDSPPDSSRINLAIAAAVGHIDGRDGWLGRQIVQATWEYYLDEYPAQDFIRLPLPPIQSVTSIKYIDTDGVEQTQSANDTNYGWELSKDTHWRPRIDLKHNMSWPPTRVRRDAVRIRFVAGYADDGNIPPDYSANIPNPIKQALLLLIGHYYENAEQVVVGEGRMINLPMGTEALLTPYRVW